MEITNHQSMIDFENQHGRQLKPGMRVKFPPESEEKKGLFSRLFGMIMEDHYIVDRLEYDAKANEVKVVLTDGLKTIACPPDRVSPALTLEHETKNDAQQNQSRRMKP